MPEYKVSLTLLSLFTSTDRALEIQGDLLEESREYGKLWFYTNVGLTTFALYLRAFMKAPLKTLLVSVVLGEMLLLLFWFGPYYINQPYHRFPEYLEWLSFEQEYFYFIFMPLFSCLYGASLIGLIRTIGAQVLVTSFLVFALLIFTIYGTSLLYVPESVVEMSALFGGLLLGGMYLLSLVMLPMLIGGYQLFRMKNNRSIERIRRA